jgi:hypothetical protein
MQETGPEKPTKEQLLKFAAHLEEHAHEFAAKVGANREKRMANLPSLAWQAPAGRRRANQGIAKRMREWAAAKSE